MKIWVALLCFLAWPVAAASVKQGTRPWPNGIVPYRIAPELLKTAGASGKDCVGWNAWPAATAAHKACKAMDAWHRTTGVRFIARDQIDTVAIAASDKATTATLGRLPVGNRVTIEARASYGSVLHEFGHILGLMHEHQRPDRSEYLALEPYLLGYLANCGLTVDAVCNDVRNAFPVVKVSLTSDYDPCSLMHYLSNQSQRHKDPRWSRIFTMTDKGETALKACLPQFAKLEKRCRKVGQKCAISQQDAAVVRRFHRLKK